MTNFPLPPVFLAQQNSMTPSLILPAFPAPQARTHRRPPNTKRGEKEMTNSDTKRIAELNDLCRKSMGVTGRLIQTRGFNALPAHVKSAIREKVETFDSFTGDNNPYGEHDFGAIEHEGTRIFWKIDYYAPDMMHGSENPADPK